MTHRSAEPAARTADPASSRSAGNILHAGPRFERLLVGHRPGSPPEATLALAALAALCGLSFDGTAMPGSWRTEFGHTGEPVRQSWVVRELGTNRKLVRRGLDVLVEAGEAEDRDGWAVATPDALAERAALGVLVRLDRHHRQLGLGAVPLLVLGFLAARAQDGRVRLGVTRLGEALGLARRTVERAMRTLRCAGVIRTRVLSVGPGILETLIDPTPGEPAHADERVQRDEATACPKRRDPRPETAGPHVPKRRDPRPETAGPMSRNGGRIQESEGLMQDSEGLVEEADVPSAAVLVRETGTAPVAAPAAAAEPAPTRPPPPPLRPRPLVAVDPSDTPARRRARLAVAVALEAGRPADAAAAIVAVLGDQPTDDALAELLAGVADPAQVRAAMREVRECGPTAQQRHTQNNQPQEES